MNPTALSPTGVGLFKPLPTGGARDRMPTTELEDPRVKLMRKWSQEMPEAARAGLHARGGEEEDEEPNGDARSVASAYSTYSRAPSVMSASFLETNRSSFRDDLHKVTPHSTPKKSPMKQGKGKNNKKGNKGQQHAQGHQTSIQHHKDGHVVITQTHAPNTPKKRRNKKGKKGNNANTNPKQDHSNTSSVSELINQQKKLSKEEITAKWTHLNHEIQQYLDFFKTEVIQQDVDLECATALKNFIDTPSAETLEAAYETLDKYQKQCMQTQINHYREVNDMKHGTTTDKMKKIPKRFKAYIVLPEELFADQVAKKIEEDNGPYKLALNAIHAYWTIESKYYKHFVDLKQLDTINPGPWLLINKHLASTTSWKNLWNSYRLAYESKERTDKASPVFTFGGLPDEDAAKQVWNRPQVQHSPAKLPGAQLLPRPQAMPVVYQTPERQVMRPQFPMSPAGRTRVNPTKRLDFSGAGPVHQVI